MRSRSPAAAVLAAVAVVFGSGGAATCTRGRAGGGRAAGVRQVGGHSFEVGDFRQARFCGLLLPPRTRPRLRLPFGVGADARRGSHVLRVTQYAPLAEGRCPVDVGGVEYQVDIR